jgi:hypothetical protein
MYQATLKLKNNIAQFTGETKAQVRQKLFNFLYWLELKGMVFRSSTSITIMKNNRIIKSFDYA